MAKSLKSQKLVVVDTRATLPELGGISGPIINPCLIDIEIILRMLNNHRKVYEVNPNNQDERIRVTLNNLRLENFPPANIKVKANVAPAVIPDDTSKKFEKNKYSSDKNVKNTKETVEVAEDIATSDFTKK